MVINLSKSLEASHPLSSEKPNRIQRCLTEATEPEDVCPRDFTTVGQIPLGTLIDDIEASFPAAKVTSGTPLFALKCTNSVLKIYNFGLPDEELVKIKEAFLASRAEPPFDGHPLKGVNIYSDPFESTAGQEWKISGESGTQVIVATDAGFNINASFFSCKHELAPLTLKLQACDPKLQSQFFSFEMTPFSPKGEGSAFPYGGCFFSGIMDFSVPEGLKENMEVNGTPWVVIAAERLAIEIKAAPQPPATE